MREIDIHEYMNALMDIIQQGKDVSFLITGSSMSPFLCHQRDTIIISKPDQPFHSGDMVFYIRPNGQYVMHRIHHLDHEGNLYLIGDAQTEIEGPLHPDCVFGIIHKVIRKGKSLDAHDFWWIFFEKIWIHMIPLRPFFIKMVAFFHH